MDNSFYEEQEPLTWYERLKYIFIKPSKIFSNLVQHPKILFPLLTIIIGMIVLVVIRIDLFKEYIMSNTQQLDGQGTNNISIIIGIISFALFPIMILLVKSSFIHRFVPIFGGEANYKKIFSVISYAYFPVMIGEVIIAIISLVTGQFEVGISFSELLPKSMENGFLYVFLGQINIFIVWYQVLAIIGTSYIYEIKRKHAAIPVLMTWLSWLLITSGFQVIGEWISGTMG